MTTKRLNLATLLVLTVFGPGAARADLLIDWWTLGSGGDMSSAGGSLKLSGTAGQPDAGAALSGGTFQLAGGFWPATTPACLGDCNCDGVIDFNDINSLVAALSDPAGVCFFPNLDMTFDGVIDFDDISPFVEILSGSGGPCP